MTTYPEARNVAINNVIHWNAFGIWIKNKYHCCLKSLYQCTFFANVWSVGTYIPVCIPVVQAYNCMHMPIIKIVCICAPEYNLYPRTGLGFCLCIFLLQAPRVLIIIINKYAYQLVSAYTTGTPVPRVPVTPAPAYHTIVCIRSNLPLVTCSQLGT